MAQTSNSRIEEIKWNRLNYAFQCDITRNIIDCVEHDEVVLNRCNASYVELKAAFQAETVALESTFKSPLTATVTETNQKREQLYLYLKEITDANLRNYNPELKQAAEHVRYILDVKKVNLRAPLEEKTSQLFVLLDTLHSDCTQALATLGLTDYVSQLEEANGACYTAMFNREHETMYYNYRAAREARDKVESLVDKILNDVNAMAQLGNPADFEQFILYVNAEIARLKRWAPSYAHTSSNKKDDEPEVIDPTPDDGEQQPDNTPDETPTDPDNGNQGGSGSLTPDPDAPNNPDNGGNTNPGGGYVPPSNGGGFD